MCNSSFWIYKRHIQVKRHILFNLGFCFFPSLNFSPWQKQGPTFLSSLSLFLCKFCCIIPKWSSGAPLLHSPLSKDILHSSKRPVQLIHLPLESPLDPVNRSPSLHRGRQISPTCFLVDSCDTAAHVSQEFCPGWCHLCCDDLCESLSEDLQDDTA